MSRVALTAQVLSVAGLANIVFTAPTGTGANNGWSFPNDGRTILLVNNGNAGNATPNAVQNGSKAQGAAVSNPSIVIPTTKNGAFWLPPQFFNDLAGNGLSYVDVDVATCTAAAIQMPPSFQ